jgi:hypothetical protein
MAALHMWSSALNEARHPPTGSCIVSLRCAPSLPIGTFHPIRPNYMRTNAPARFAGVATNNFAIDELIEVEAPPAKAKAKAKAE